MADDINLMDYMAGSDWLGIALAVIAAFFIGFIWFTFLFGKQWAAEFNMEMGGDESSFKAMLPSMIKDIVGNFLTAYVLWHSIVSFMPEIWADHLGATAENAGAITYGLWGGFFIWLGYFVPVALSRTGWEQRSWTWFGIDIGYNFVKLMAMGAILAHFASGV